MKSFDYKNLENYSIQHPQIAQKFQKSLNSFLTGKEDWKIKYLNERASMIKKWNLISNRKK